MKRYVLVALFACLILVLMTTVITSQNSWPKSGPCYLPYCWPVVFPTSAPHSTATPDGFVATATPAPPYWPTPCCTPYPVISATPSNTPTPAAMPEVQPTDPPRLSPGNSNPPGKANGHDKPKKNNGKAKGRTK